MTAATLLRSSLPMRLARLLRRAAERLEPPSTLLLPAANEAEAAPNAPSCVRFFDSFASQYDEGAARAWPIKRYVSQEVADLGRKFQSALVVGVGTGQELEPLFLNEVSDVEAIDVSENMLHEAREKYPNVNYHCADFLTFTGFKRRSYELILCCGVLEYVEDLPAFMQKASGLLSPGGLIFLTFTPILPSHPLQYEETTRHSDYLDFRMHRYSFEHFYSVMQSCELSLRKCFTFNCHIDANLGITNICFFCVLEKP